MSDKLLFVFEGEKTEPQIVNSLSKFFLQGQMNIICAYCGEIYQLFEEIAADSDLDTFNIVKERSKANTEILNNYRRDDFSGIYLFFDYEGHSTMADDRSIRIMLNFFAEETDKGKLFISYPMVEAVRHISDFETFFDVVINCYENIGYKELVSHAALKELKHVNSYDMPIWKAIIIAHLKKANFVVTDSWSFPENNISQAQIFYHQLEKYIKTNSSVAVLSAFPSFLQEYYGNIRLREILD